MSKYTANYETSNGTRNAEPFEFTNLKEARKSIREIANGECFEGDTAHWSVQNAKGETVAEGTVR